MRERGVMSSFSLLSSSTGAQRTSADLFFVCAFQQPPFSCIHSRLVMASFASASSASTAAAESSPSAAAAAAIPASAPASVASPVAGDDFLPSTGIDASSSRIQLSPYWAPGSASDSNAVAESSSSDGIRFELLRLESDSNLSLIQSLRCLIREYFSFTGIDLSFQNVESELEHLPGHKYTQQGGGFLYTLHVIATTTPSSDSASAPQPEEGKSEQLVACVALKDLGNGICEAKRLFVRPQWRGRDLGRLLLVQMVDIARQTGYETLRLDTLARFAEANALYKNLGFQKIQAYNYNPQPDVLFFQLEGLQEKKYLREGREEAFALWPRKNKAGRESTLSASPPAVNEEAATAQQ